MCVNKMQNMFFKHQLVLKFLSLVSSKSEFPTISFVGILLFLAPKILWLEQVLTRQVKEWIKKLFKYIWQNMNKSFVK